MIFSEYYCLQVMVKLLIEEKICKAVEYFHRKQSDPPGYDDPSSSALTLLCAYAALWFHQTGPLSPGPVQQRRMCKPGKQALYSLSHANMQQQLFHLSRCFAALCMYGIRFSYF